MKTSIIVAIMLIAAAMFARSRFLDGSTAETGKEEVLSPCSFIEYGETSKDISEKIDVYLQDDTFELTADMTLVQVDKIWGRPDEVERKYVREDKEMYWTYGDYWASDSKLKGLFYHKKVKFVNGEVSYWLKNGKIKIKTHSRDDVSRSHLDEGTALAKGMNKLEVYETYGLPASFETRYFGDKIDTRWMFEKDDRLSHYVSFENSKVVRWGDY